jgi:hypothetical protein
MTINKLNWTEMKTDQFKADTAIGSWEVVKRIDKFLALFIIEGEETYIDKHKSYYDSAEEAKVVCQQHYENIVKKLFLVENFTLEEDNKFLTALNEQLRKERDAKLSAEIKSLIRRNNRHKT